VPICLVGTRQVGTPNSFGLLDSCLQTLAYRLSSAAMLSFPAQEAFALYLLIINLATAAAFWRDKHCARNSLWRVPERTLLTMAFAGGTLGAIAAQHGLRHKMRKEPFRTILYSFGGLHLAAVVALTVPNVRDALSAQSLPVERPPQQLQATISACKVRVIDARRNQVLREAAC
jgi:uncharacterized membrane protein YsdA (DUF1294 family)